MATRSGTCQASVSRAESVHQSSWNSDTLRKFASAFNLRLRVSFEPRETLAEEVDAFISRTTNHLFARPDLALSRLADLLKAPQSKPPQDQLPAQLAFFTNPALEMRPTVIDEMAVINRLWELVTLRPDETRGNITGQTRAANALAEIKGMKLLRKADLEAEFRDRTPEEMTFFAINGYWPNDADATTPITPAYRDPTQPAPGGGPTNRREGESVYT